MSTAPDAPRVLVVEDDPDQRSLICEALELHYGRERPAEIVPVATGAECFAQELAGFDVVLLDFHLPDVDGLTALERILSAADVPVIFVTGESDSALAVEAVKRGAQDYVVKRGDFLFAVPVIIEKSINLHRIKRENQRLGEQLERTLAELQRKNAQLEQSLAKLSKMASTDHLTGLFNRRRFAEDLARHFAEAVRYGHDLTCCMCDLDHYKQLNDAHGHQVGDEVLVESAAAIRSMLRASDLAARYGGDEFVLLLPHTDTAQAHAAAQRLRGRLAARLRASAEPACAVTLSIGIASLRADHPDTAELLVTMADRALYAAKEAGRDRVVLYADLTASPAHRP